MARLSNIIDVASLPESKEVSVLPAGTYTVQITNSDVRKSGKGYEYLWIELTIVRHEELNRRKVFDRIMLEHSNPEALNIHQRRLRTLGEACGLMRIEYSEQIIGKVIIAQVTVEPARGEYKESNGIRSYRECPDLQPAAVSAQPAPKLASAPAPEKIRRPW